MPPGTAQHKQSASEPVSRWVHPKPIKQSHALAQLLKLPAKLAEHFFPFFSSLPLSLPVSLSHSMSLLLPLILMLVFGPCQAITTCYISFCDFFDSSLLDPSALLLLLLLAIFHMQHATDVFMFCVCAAHKKINEPRGGRRGKRKQRKAARTDRGDAVKRLEVNYRINLVAWLVTWLDEGLLFLCPPFVRSLSLSSLSC